MEEGARRNSTVREGDVVSQARSGNWETRKGRSSVTSNGSADL